MKLFQSRFCGISAIFFQCCLWLKHNYYTIINDSFQFSNFSGVFARNQFLEGGFTFQWGWEFAFLLWRGGFIFKWGGHGGHLFWYEEGFKKNHRIGGGVSFHAPTMGNLAYHYYHYHYYCHYYHHYYTAL